MPGGAGDALASVDLAGYEPGGTGGVPTDLTREVASLFDSGNGVKYNILRKRLLEVFPSAPRPALLALECIALLQGEPSQVTPLTHLFLECISRCASGHSTVRCFELEITRSYVADADARAAAKRFLLGAARAAAAPLSVNEGAGGGMERGRERLEPPRRPPPDPRVVVKFAQVFGLYAEDLDASEAGDVRAYAASLLEADQYSPAVSLILQFQMEDMATEDLVVTLAFKQETLAMDFAKHMRRDLRVTLARAATGAGQYKLAYKAVKQFSLYDEFPDAQFMYKKEGINRMASRGQWDVAVAYVEDVEDRRLKVELMRLLLEMEELERAAEMRARWALEAEFPVVEARDVDRTQYLPLALPEGRVHLVDTGEQLGALWGPAVLAAEAVGLDCEWKPNFIRGGGKSRVALLQIGTGEEVLLLDMQVLYDHHREALDTALTALMCDPGIIKLGFALGGDLKALGASFPELGALSRVQGWLEVPALWQRLHPEAPTPPGGLSGLCRDLLGLPLYKGVRTSDWERRPLTAAQVTYAALDAHCLVLLFQVLRARGGAGAASAAGAGDVTGADTGAGAMAGAGRPIWSGLLRNYQVGVRAGVAGGAPEAEAEQGEEAVAPLGLAEVLAALQAAGLDAPEVLQLEEDCATCEQAAAALSCDVSSVVKSLGLAFATPEQCVRMFGFAPGSMPPVGHRYPPTAVYLDQLQFQRAAARQEGGGQGGQGAALFAGAGTNTSMWKASGVRQFLEVSGADVADVARGSGLGGGTRAAASEGPPRFLVDASMGRLSRWLRALGVDAEDYPSRGAGEEGGEGESPPGGRCKPEHRALLARAGEQRRTVLTRDRRLAARRGTASACYFVESDSPREQLRQVMLHFGIVPAPGSLLSRCSACNGPEFVIRDKAEVAAGGEVSERVLAAVTTFYSCGQCQKLYWVGPKSQAAVEMLEGLLSQIIPEGEGEGGAGGE